MPRTDSRITYFLSLFAETFEEYAHQVFIPYISRQLQNVSRLDLVWDRYVAGSLKATARAKCGKGIRQGVISSARILKNWQIFLRVDLNKQELFSFLSKTLTESVEHQKELVVTDRMQVLCMPAQQDTHLLAPCKHEEADSCMMLHVQHAAQHGHHQILVRTVDTDVVV